MKRTGKEWIRIDFVPYRVDSSKRCPIYPHFAACNPLKQKEFTGMTEQVVNLDSNSG